MTDQFTLDHLYADPSLSEVVGKDYVLASFPPPYRDWETGAVSAARVGRGLGFG